MHEPGGRSLGPLIKKRWRAWLRAIHRDFGYLAVGFTIIYAVSGLAINHIADWDPNFTSYTRESTIAPIPADVPDADAIARAQAALGVTGPRSVLRAGDEIHLDWDKRSIVVYGDSGLVVDQGREARFFLRVANWLHYNRGKKAWTYMADVYAVMLLYLAISGLFMIKGKLGLKWRGTMLVSAGFAVPLLYVVLSGGPDASQKADASVPAVANPTAPAPSDELAPRPPPGVPTPGADRDLAGSP
jgi:hypothetical protein